MQYFKELNQLEFWDLYDKRMKEDFPENEIRSEKNFRQLFKENRYLVFGWFEEEELLGYATFIRITNFVLGDYIALKSNERGKGYGTIFLQKCREYLSMYEFCICEVENPNYSIDLADRKIRERRIEFYKREGFIETGVETVAMGDSYQILAFSCGDYPASKLREKNWEDIVYQAYHVIFPEDSYWKRIQIIVS